MAGISQKIKYQPYRFLIQQWTTGKVHCVLFVSSLMPVVLVKIFLYYFISPDHFLTYCALLLGCVLLFVWKIRTSSFCVGKRVYSQPSSDVFLMICRFREWFWIHWPMFTSSSCCCTTSIQFRVINATNSKGRSTKRQETSKAVQEWCKGRCQCWWRYMTYC